MAVTTAILAPWAKDEVTRLGQKTYKKRILRFGKVKTEDGEFDFTPEFGQSMIEAFQAGVIDSVPLQLAPADNSHTQAVDRVGGEIVGLELSNDGLDGFIRANDDTSRLINENPRMGVSIRALQGRIDNNGKRWPAILHHVLATFDPVVTGMGQWQPVELSHDVTKVINLANPAGSNHEGTSSMAKKTIADALSTEDAEALYALLGKALGKDGDTENTEDGTEPTEDDKKDDEIEPVAATLNEDEIDVASLTDDELEALLLSLDDDTESENPDAPRGTVDTGVTVEDRELEPIAASVSGDNGSVVELANARMQEQAIELSRIRVELDGANFEKERDSLARTSGLPPRIIDLARPLLEGTGRVVQLSNGEKADAGQVVRSVFTEIGKTLKALDLSHPSGFAIADEGDEDSAEVEDRAAFITRVKEQFRLG